MTAKVPSSLTVVAFLPRHELGKLLRTDLAKQIGAIFGSGGGMSMVRRLWQALSPQLRSALRDKIEAFRHRIAVWRFWQWEMVLLRSEPRDIVFLGCPAARGQAAALFAAAPQPVATGRRALSALRSGGATLVSEPRLPGAIPVPAAVRMVFPVRSGRMKLPARRRKLAEQHRVVRVVDRAEIERINSEMLVPFALDRYGPGAALIALPTVEHLARVGRLDVLLHGDEEVAAQLSFPSERNGKRYWECCRFGYPARVFSEPKRLADVNVINAWFGLQYAEEQGFDFYDMGNSLAQPEGGLLQFKKRLGGVLDTWGAQPGYWVRPATGRAPQLFWSIPLFGLEPRGLVLHLGIPARRTAAEVLERVREVGFEGLVAVRLHAEKEVDAAVWEGLRQKFGPTPIELAAAGAPAASSGRSDLPARARSGQ